VAWKTGVVLAGAVLVLIAAVGIARIRINNMVAWFKPGARSGSPTAAEPHLGGTATLTSSPTPGSRTP
jgi:hypothetical protein